MIRAEYAGPRVHRDRHHLAGEIGDLVDDLDPGERAAYQAEMFEHWRRDDAIAEQYGPFDNIGSRGHRLDHLRNRSGASSGTDMLWHIGSHELGTVEDLLPGSSPMRATAPPIAAVPATLLCRIASAARSRPGFSPYQKPTTPSWRAPGT
jgi:hypothetical protein